MAHLPPCSARPHADLALPGGPNTLLGFVQGAIAAAGLRVNPMTSYNTVPLQSTSTRVWEDSVGGSHAFQAKVVATTGYFTQTSSVRIMSGNGDDYNGGWVWRPKDARPPASWLTRLPLRWS